MTTSTRAKPAITMSSATGTAPEGLLDAVTTMVRNGHLPGLSLAVVDANRVLFASGFGNADLTSDTPAQPTTSYLWFSMSKIVTATAAMRLADDGQLDLNAPAREYVDYLRAPGSRQPTVRELLNHTSGMGNPMPIRWAHRADVDPPDPAVLLRRLMSRRRAYRYPVGQRAHYSNVNYLAVGEVMAAAAGQPFKDYVRRGSRTSWNDADRVQLLAGRE